MVAILVKCMSNGHCQMDTCILVTRFHPSKVKEIGVVVLSYKKMPIFHCATRLSHSKSIAITMLQMCMSFCWLIYIYIYSN